MRRLLKQVSLEPDQVEARCVPCCRSRAAVFSLCILRVCHSEAGGAA